VFGLCSRRSQTRIRRCAAAAGLLLLFATLAASGRQADVFDDPLEELRKQVDADLSRDLRGVLPNLPALFAQEGIKSDDLQLRNGLRDMLEKEKTISAELHPALLLAIDLVAEKLWCDSLESVECRRLRDEMAPHHLTWAWDQLGAGWFYQHDFLWRLQKEFSSSPWDEVALILLLDRGWDTSIGCTNGTDRFREVIKQGEAFLAAHPAHARRAEVLFLVAQAYETWWSLSKAPKDDDYANAAAYQQGAPAAREKAIQNYEEVTRVAPQSRLAEAAREVAAKLKQGRDTSQRRFFCIYD